jgi:hypothetical protein
MDEKVLSSVGALAKKVPPKVLSLAGLGALGYSGVKGMQQAGEQSNRAQDLINARKEDLAAPLPSFTVTASYDEFAARKIAAFQPSSVPGYASNQASFVLANTLANKLVGEPIEAAHSLIKKKFYEEPKQRQAFQHAIKDPDIAQAMLRNPEHIHGAFKTLKQFGPSLASDPNVVRSFLRQAMMAGGQLDYATIRSLAETEKFVQQSRGKGGKE